MLFLLVKSIFPGATEETRTPDLLITNQLLYQLSYIGTSAMIIIAKIGYFVQCFSKKDWTNAQPFVIMINADAPM